MPTAGLTGEGLKKYQRWLAVQRAKGREPAPGEIQSFLQGEIQANIATDIDRQALGLREQALKSETDIANRRLDLISKDIDRQSGADTIRGLSEIAKGVGAVNQLTGGAVTEGLKWAGSQVYDFFGGGDQVATTAADLGGEFAAFDFSDVFDWSDLF